MQKIIRVAMFIIFFVTLLNSLFFIVLGVYKSVHAYTLLAQRKLEERPAVLIAESLDSFMIALFLIIFSLSISKLFLPRSKYINAYELPWLKIDNFSQLKYILWEMLLTTLFVYFTGQVIIASNHLEWIILILPVSILLLALAFKLIRQPH